MENNLYKIKTFGEEQTKRGGGGGAHFRYIKTDTQYYEDIKRVLNKIKEKYNIIYYEDFKNLPITFHFSKLLGKSHRFKILFHHKEIKQLHQIDSKYIYNENNSLEDKMNITYLISVKQIEFTVNVIEEILNFISINQNIFNEIYKEQESNNKPTKKDKNISDLFNECNFNESIFSKNQIKKLFIDFFFLENFNLYEPNIEEIIDGDYFIRLNSLLSFDQIQDIFKKHNIHYIKEDLFISKNNLTFQSNKKILQELNSKFPFLINVASKNYIKFSNKHKEIKKYAIIDKQKMNRQIQNAKKNNEIPNFQIGVIDTHASFIDDWKSIIEVHNSDLPSNLSADTSHGTMVSSIIAGNDLFNNKKYIDGLGIFKVKHFGIIPRNGIEIFSFLKQLENIIKNNPNVKLWNLSVSEKTKSTKISPKISELGKHLDRLQSDYNVLFIIAAGNDGIISHGSDSLLSITVGSIFKDKNNKIKKSSYCSEKRIFNLFDKPNAYDFGNDITQNNNIDDQVWFLTETADLDYSEEGTSISTPLITRKCASLMHKYNLGINAVKAYINLENDLYKNNDLLKTINVNLNNDESIITIFYEGEITPGKELETKIKLPFKEIKNKLYRNFLAATSVSYSINNSVFVGDEYSSVEISLKLLASVEKEKDGEIKKANVNLIEKKSNSKKDLTLEEQTNITLVNENKKYNPNKTIIDKSIIDKTIIKNSNDNLIKIERKPYKLFDKEDNSFIMKINCTDIFNNKEKVKFGFAIKLFEIEKNSLLNFEQENSKILDIIIEKTKIRQKL